MIMKDVALQCQIHDFPVGTTNFKERSAYLWQANFSKNYTKIRNIGLGGAVCPWDNTPPHPQPKSATALSAQEYTNHLEYAFDVLRWSRVFGFVKVKIFSS